ncbi:hypothetical protein P3T76_006858 [Phytophthora citrophthora]|uniref:Uncharacterized protein n=1 Tax=Phytophthora citrophthora TaxID=4793 RepID=A0AAD9GNR5_9STRA|nr:hypothetical protein P3T76_006858 [Phytophthora citrophthora]
MSWSQSVGSKSKTLGCLSPGNLLVSWLVTPGNYKRWTSQAKGPLEEEIVQLMVDHGIRDRSQRYVYDKIRNLKRSYMSAREYLMQQGQLTRFIEHKASQNVEKKAQRRCSYFRELSVLFECNGEVDAPQDESSGELHHNGGQRFYQCQKD